MYSSCVILPIQVEQVNPEEAHKLFKVNEEYEKLLVEFNVLCSRTESQVGPFLRFRRFTDAWRQGAGYLYCRFKVR